MPFGKYLSISTSTFCDNVLKYLWYLSTISTSTFVRVFVEVKYVIVVIDDIFLT
jgi:hypothetical protein